MFSFVMSANKRVSLPRFWHWLIFISKHVVFDEEIFTILDRRLSSSSPLSAHLPGMTSIDYYETFSLAIKWMLALLNGISGNWKSPMPFYMGFWMKSVNGIIEGFYRRKFPNYVCRLIVQHFLHFETALRAWFRLLSQQLILAIRNQRWITPCLTIV